MATKTKNRPKHADAVRFRLSWECLDILDSVCDELGLTRRTAVELLSRWAKNKKRTTYAKLLAR